VFARGLLKSLTNLTLTVKNLYSKLGCFLGVLWYRIVNDFVHFWGRNEFKAIRRCHFCIAPRKHRSILHRSISVVRGCPGWQISRAAWPYLDDIFSSVCCLLWYFEGSHNGAWFNYCYGTKILLIAEWTRNSNSLKYCTKRWVGLLGKIKGSATTGLIGTLGSRGFSCAVSAFGQVLKSDRQKTCRPVDDEAPRRKREKPSGTQGTGLVTPG